MFTFLTRTKFGITICVLPFILIAGLIFATSQALEFERQRDIEKAVREEANLLLAFEESVRRDIDGVEEILREVDGEYAKTGRIMPSLLKHIQSTRSLPLVHISYANEKGIIESTTIPELLMLDISGGEYFQHFRTANDSMTYFAKPVIGRQTKNWIFHMSRRLNKADGSFGGTATVGINPARFGEFYSKMQLGKGFEIALVGFDGFVRVQQTSKKMDVGTNVQHARFFNLMQQQNTGTYIEESATDNVKRIYSFRTISNYPFVLVIAVQAEDALDDFYRLQQQYWLFTGLGCLVIFLLFGMLIRIAAQQEEIERILRQANDELTEKVAQRTEELQTSQTRYRALMEQSFEALALIDIKTQEVVEVNRRFTEQFGFSLPEDAPLYVSKFMTESKRQVDEFYSSTLLHKRVLHPEPKVYRHKNGMPIYGERAGTVIEIDGRDYLLASMRDMTEERRRQAELTADAEFARRVQRELLPEIPVSTAVDVKTIYHPSNFVSGDSYHLEWRNEGKLLRGFLIDVSGHGLATAIQTSSVNVLLRESAIVNWPLIDQMRWINSRVAKYFTDGAFAAMFGFELDLPLQELRFVGAGITQFYANGRRIETPGMFVGLWNEAEFHAGTMPVSAGDTFHFLSDGFTDVLAQLGNVDFWSPDGRNFDADVAALERLANNERLRDDATAVCMKVKGI